MYGPLGVALGACGDVAGGVPVVRGLPHGVRGTFANVVKVRKVKLSPRGGGPIAKLLAGELQAVLFE